MSTSAPKSLLWVVFALAGILTLFAPFWASDVPNLPYDFRNSVVAAQFDPAVAGAIRTSSWGRFAATEIALLVLYFVSFGGFLARVAERRQCCGGMVLIVVSLFGVMKLLDLAPGGGRGQWGAFAVFLMLVGRLLLRPGDKNSAPNDPLILSVLLLWPAIVWAAPGCTRHWVEFLTPLAVLAASSIERLRRVGLASGSAFLEAGAGFLYSASGIIAWYAVWFAPSRIELVTLPLGLGFLLHALRLTEH